MALALKVICNYPCQHFCRILLRTRISHLGPRNNWNRCLYCKDSRSDTRFGQSMILLQDGVNFQELPIIVRKGDTTLEDNSNVVSSSEIEPVGEDAVFENCRGIEDVLEVLDKTGTHRVSPKIAFQALKKFAEIGCNLEYRNQGSIKHIQKESAVGNSSFTLDSVLLQLVSKICKLTCSQDIVDCLKLICLPSFPASIKTLHRDAASECLNRILDNKCSVTQVCEAMKVFSQISKYDDECKTWVDKIWVGLLHNDGAINDKNILNVFQIIPLLKESQGAVFRVVERRFGVCLSKVDVDTVTEILRVVEKTGLPHRRICTQVSQWLSVVLHSFSEDSLKNIVQILMACHHFDSIMGRTLERYMRVKSTAISDQVLIATIANYCKRFRFRSSIILNALAEYLIKHSHNLSCPTIESIITTMGTLHFQPANEFEFWSASEELLSAKLIQFPVDSLLDIMLSCVYLQRYPMNFVHRIFSPHFLHRLHSQTSTAVDSSRAKIQLLDTAMEFECSQYDSRILPKEYANMNLGHDGRIIRLGHYLVPHLEEIAGVDFLVTTSVLLSGLPLNSIYVVDVMISPVKQVGFVHRFGAHRRCPGTVAVLVHPTEHFCHDKSSLIGLQLLRHRHLQHMGFRVVHLDYEQVIRLINQNEDGIRKFLQLHLSHLKLFRP